MSKREIRDLVCMLFGDFTDPQTGTNFIILRIPNGSWSDGYIRRLPWSRKIEPAMKRLVHEIVGKDVWYTLDGDSGFPEKSLWDTRIARRYSWDAETDEFRLESTCTIE